MDQIFRRCWMNVAVVLLALGTMAGNCGDQLAATFDQDGSIQVNPGPQDAAVADRVPGDHAIPDRAAADLARADAARPDGAGRDAIGTDTAGNDAAGTDANVGIDVVARDGGNYHPGNWYTDHRAATLLGQSDCRVCHGSDLAGGAVNVSCDLCHTAGWRTNCVFCHGATDNQTGAPPVDLRGRTATSNSTVGAHTTHVKMVNRIHPDYACTQCHVMPTDVLTAGHLFDSTPGQAELVFGGGISPNGSYDFGSATCNAVYCHGNGHSDGTSPVHTASISVCSACHPSMTSTETDWRTMSGRHASHLRFGFHCDACHGQVVDTDSNFVAPDLHVNGAKNVQPLGGAYDGTNCTTSCHSGTRAWPQPVVDGGGFDAETPLYHSDPQWPLASHHGLAAEEGQVPLCNTCHGASLQGQAAIPNCDGCHTPSDPPAWRTDCIFCHGGYSGDTTGAPPFDLHNSTSSTTRTVGAHREHIGGGTHLAYDCIQCHLKPTSATSPGHMFDSTPNRAEVGFGSGGALSPSGSYNQSATTCGNLYCHGSGKAAGQGSAPAFTTAINNCNACHPDWTTSSRWPSMSGEHDRHIQVATCSECHASVVNSSNAIIGPSLHANGARNNQFPSGMVYSGGTCTGSCHTEDHVSNPW